MTKLDDDQVDPEELADVRLVPLIGVIDRPDTEIQNRYFQISLAHQFDKAI